MKVLSLGWGVQSFTLAAMAILGEVEPLEAALHADTGHESALTYAFADRWTPWLEAGGLRVITVRDLRQSGPADQWGGVFIPAFTSDGRSRGQLRRQCTQCWKIAPMRRWLQANRHGQAVEQWLGISLDEATRMRPSDVRYISNRWPLVERRMTRADCADWLVRHALEVPPKSSCTFCPFHDAAGWRQTARVLADWSEAIAVDAAIRNLRPPHDLFVHPSRRPLVSVDLRTAEERGQIGLWDEECTGTCRT